MNKTDRWHALREVKTDLVEVRRIVGPYSRTEDVFARKILDLTNIVERLVEIVDDINNETEE